MANFNPNAIKVFNGRFDAGKFNKLVDLLLRGQLRSGPNYTLSQGAGGTVIVPTGGGSASVSAWPFKVYNKTAGPHGQVQINGGDGLVASLSPFAASPDGIALVNGQRNDTKSGTPGAYPLLAVTGNGDVYVYAALNSSGLVTSVNVYYGGSTPSPDTANPPTYVARLLATITNYATDDSGNVTLSVNDANGPQGLTTVSVCGATASIT